MKKALFVVGMAVSLSVVFTSSARAVEEVMGIEPITNIENVEPESGSAPEMIADESESGAEIESLTENDGKNGFHIKVSSLPITLSIKPGESQTVPIRVQNAGTKEERLKVTVRKFQAYGEKGEPKIMEREDGDEFLSWVTFSEDEFNAAPSEWKTVKATFALPKTASFGYYYAIVFSRAEDENIKEGQIGVAGGTAVLVLLEANISGASRELAISDFRKDKRWYEFLPVGFTLRVENKGNVHTAPFGSIFIQKKGEKEDLAVLSFNAGRGFILPNSFREFTSKWEEGFPSYHDKKEGDDLVKNADGSIEQELVWDWKNADKFRFGKYQAKLVLAYDDGKRDVPVESMVEFWVIPWRIMLAVIVVVGLLGFALLSLVWKMGKGMVRGKSGK